MDIILYILNSILILKVETEYKMWERGTERKFTILSVSSVTIMTFEVRHGFNNFNIDISIIYYSL